MYINPIRCQVDKRTCPHWGGKEVWVISRSVDQSSRQFFYNNKGNKSEWILYLWIDHDFTDEQRFLFEVTTEGDQRIWQSMEDYELDLDMKEGLSDEDRAEMIIHSPVHHSGWKRSFDEMIDYWKMLNIIAVFAVNM